MKIDDLRDEMRAAAQRAESAVRIDLGRIRARGRKKSVSALQRLRLWLILELGLNGVALLFLGSFLVAHVTEPRFVLCALVLHLVTIAQAIVGIRQLVWLRGLDLAGALVPVQRRLETLRIERIRATVALLLVAPLLWVPLLAVVVEAAFQVDVFRVVSTSWVAVNVGLGVVFVPAMPWLARRQAHRFAGSPLVRRLVRDLAGYNLSAAQGFLAELAEIEATSSPSPARPAP